MSTIIQPMAMMTGGRELELLNKDGAIIFNGADKMLFFDGLIIIACEA